MRTPILTALALLFAPAALAAPPVIFHVPDGQVEEVPGVDARLGDERSSVELTAEAVDEQKARKHALKRVRKQARAQLRREARQLRRSKRALRQAERRDDPAQAAWALANVELAAQHLADAEDHVEWHEEQFELTRAKLRQARVERSLARAEIELEQAQILDELDDDDGRPVIPTAVYANQVDRISDRASIREAEVAIEVAESTDDHVDYFSDDL